LAAKTTPQIRENLKLSPGIFHSTYQSTLDISLCCNP